MIPFFLPLLIASTKPNSVIPTETKAHHEQRMKWWREARFGMFIHWGLYSIPAGKWGDKTSYGEWIRESAHIPVDVYDKFQGQFNPTKFDANKWAAMAKDAGMKYVVITTKHHDGFNLFPSKFTDWSVKNTPFHRDIMWELSKAVRKKGLTMGWYHSIMDWHHPDYLPRRTWEAKDRPADGADFDRFVKYLRNDVTQLLTNYGPIGVMWFDGEWENTWNAKYGDALYALCRKLQPNVIVNNRVSVGRGGIEDAGKTAGDYGTPEQTIPATGLPGQDWETCMTMNDNWGYNAYDRHWKSSYTLLRNLIDIASKGGNYLLNIGPRSDGTFPPEAVQRLHEIGQWMHVNGECIYDTTASVFDKLPWGRSTTKVEGDKTTLYLQVFNWPKDGRIVVPGIGNEPISAHVLGQMAYLRATRVGSDIVVRVPEYPANSVATVIALKVAGTPTVYRAPVIEADSDLIVNSTTFRVQSSSPKLVVRYTTDGTVPTGKSTLYRDPVTVTDSETVKAASFLGKKRVSGVVLQEFKKTSPIPASVISLHPGLKREVFRGNWEALPNFSKIDAEKFTIAQSLSVPMEGGKPMEGIGLRYSGFVQVPKDGVYSFELTADDGAKLWIDDRLVVDNDGLHAATTKLGRVPLAAGSHSIVVGWFNGTGGAALELKAGLAGGAMKDVGTFPLGHP